HAPHHLGRLVARRLLARADRAVQRLLRQPSIAAARTGDPIRRLRGVAARALARRAADRTRLLLEAAARRHAGTATPDGPSPTGGLELQRRVSRTGATAYPWGRATRPQPARIRDLVHDPVRRVHRAAPALHGPGRYRGGLLRRQSQPLRAGGSDRL